MYVEDPAALPVVPLFTAPFASVLVEAPILLDWTVPVPLVPVSVPDEVPVPAEPLADVPPVPPPAAPPLACASAKVEESARTEAKANVESFMVFFLFCLRRE